MLADRLGIQGYKRSKCSEIDNTYIRCAVCHCLTPFIFWVVSKKALDAYFPTSEHHGVHNLFCVDCLPRSTDELLYSDQCLFNNEDFLSLFRGYEYYDPLDARYCETNRVILTENCKIHPKYKELKRPMPRLVKMQRLFQIIPKVHQVPFEKYSTWTEVYSFLRMKQREIVGTYSEQMLHNSLMDNFDVTVERTPFRSISDSINQRIREPRTTLFPTDTIIERSSTQESEQDNERHSLQISSQTVSANGSDLLSSSSSQLSDKLMNMTSQQIDISSQSVGQIIASESLDSIVSGSDPISQQIEISTESAALEIISLESYSAMESPSMDRVLEGLHNSQEAGPSGLQQQHAQPVDTPVQPPKPKRRRISTPPVNPSPADVIALPNRITRLPRLAGG